LRAQGSRAKRESRQGEASNQERVKNSAASVCVSVPWSVGCVSLHE